MSQAPLESDAPEARKIASLEDARLLLMAKNGLPIPASDPVMMLVSLMIAFADDYDAMLIRHNKAVSTAMKGVIGTARAELEKEIQHFSEQVRSTTLENVVLLITEHQKRMIEHQQATRLLTVQCMALSALLTVVTIGVLVWKALS